MKEKKKKANQKDRKWISGGLRLVAGMHTDCKWARDLFEVMKMVKTDFVEMVEQLCKATEKISEVST